MIIQLFIFAFLFLGFGVYAIIKKKKLVGFTFVLLAFMLLAIATMAVIMYPHIMPF